MRKMFSMLYVDKIIVSVGSGTIDACVQQAIQLAKILDCAVEFEFNGKPLTAFPHSDEQQLLKEYWEGRV